MVVTSTKTGRERLHRLVDLLPSTKLAEMEERLFELAVGDDPLLRTLAEALEDDEPLSPEDEVAVAEGLAALRWGYVVSHEELRRSLGR